jgi:hypothetical protein
MSGITAGWLARHTPQGPGGRQAAPIDIAQDLLLAQPCRQGISDHLVFKGGNRRCEHRRERPGHERIDEPSGPARHPSSDQLSRSSAGARSVNRT